MFYVQRMTFHNPELEREVTVECSEGEIATVYPTGEMPANWPEVNLDFAAETRPAPSDIQHFCWEIASYIDPDDNRLALSQVATLLAPMFRQVQ